MASKAAPRTRKAKQPVVKVCTTEHFIELVKAKPIVYDRKMPDFKNELKFKAWDDIAHQSGMTRDEALKKYKHLRECFMRKMKKILLDKKNGVSVDVDADPWPHFKQLSFLGEFRVNRKGRKSGGVTFDPEELSAEELYPLEHFQAPSNGDENNGHNAESQEYILAKRSAGGQTSRIGAILERLEAGIPMSNESSSLLQTHREFFDFAALKMNRITDETLLVDVQLDVLQLINNAMKKQQENQA